MKRTLRVTGGEYRGRRISCPPGEIRPTMDRMRESLFSILGSLEGAAFLDLFAGSGIVALEAASRGANRIVAVERDRRKREIVCRNLGIAEQGIDLEISGVERYLASCTERFDFVYLDPPFSYRDKQSLLFLLSNSRAVAYESVAILHHPGDDLAEFVGRMKRTDTRRYGGSNLDFYRVISDL